jgi:hypothetical protein
VLVVFIRGGTPSFLVRADGRLGAHRNATDRTTPGQ